MKDPISYKNCLITGESFQRVKNGPWIPQYALQRPQTETTGKGSDFPSDQYQFHKDFPTESEADAYAVQMAREWVDKN